MFIKEIIPYLAPRLYSSMESQASSSQKEELSNSYKDLVYSLGLIILEFTLQGGEAQQENITQLHVLNRDKSEETLQKFLKLLGIRGFSDSLTEVIFQMLRFEDSLRPDFSQVDSLAKEKAGADIVDKVSKGLVTLGDYEDVNQMEVFLEEKGQVMGSGPASGGLSGKHAYHKTKLQPFNLSEAIARRQSKKPGLRT